MKRKIIHRNKKYLSALLSFALADDLSLSGVRSIGPSSAESVMSNRHARRFGAVADPRHPEVWEFGEGKFFVPCVSSRGVVCHFVTMTSAELDVAKAGKS